MLYNIEYRLCIFSCIVVISVATSATDAAAATSAADVAAAAIAANAPD